MCDFGRKCVGTTCLNADTACEWTGNIPQNTLRAEKKCADGQSNAKCVLSFMAVIKSIVAFSDKKK
jgi:hypothetical protein